MAFAFRICDHSEAVPSLQLVNRGLLVIRRIQSSASLTLARGWLYRQSREPIQCMVACHFDSLHFSDHDTYVWY